jgi:hypothetical protein
MPKKPLATGDFARKELFLTQAVLAQQPDAALAAVVVRRYQVPGNEEKAGAKGE